MREERFVLAASVLVAALAHVPAFANDGDLDPTFGEGGVVILDFDNGSDIAEDLVIQTDQKIVVVGNAHIDSNRVVAVVRFNPGGDLDPTFGQSGATIIEEENFMPSAIGIQSDGKIVVAGRDIWPLPRSYFLLRLDSEGALDSTFGVNGFVDFIPPISGDLGTNSQGLGVLPDDGLIVVGEFKPTGGTWDVLLAKFLPDGQLDVSFGSSGISLVDNAGRSESARSLTIQSDGKILVPGETLDSDGIVADQLLVRILNDGSLDSSFGSGGIVVTSASNDETDETGIAATVLSDGSIVMAGWANLMPVPGPNDKYVSLIRYNENGSLQSSFGAGGIVLDNLGMPDAAGLSVVRTTDDKLLVLAIASDSNQQISLLAVARYLSDGTPDPGFGSSGVVWGPLDSEPSTLLLDHFDRILVLGNQNEMWGVTNFDFLLLRLKGAQFLFADGFESGDTSAWSSSVP